MNPLKAATVFIGWLSGSLAGIGALLYAAGYLVTVAHLNLLGIDSLLVSSNERMIQQGARFLTVTGELLAKKVLGATAIVLVLALPPVVSWILLSRFAPRGAERLRRAWQAVGRGVAAAHAPLPWAPDLSRYLILFALLFTYLLSYLPSFIPPLTLSDLLYAKGEDPAGGDALRSTLLCWLLTANTGRLRTHYSALVDGEALAVAFVAAAWYVSRRRVRRGVLVAPFVAVFALYTVYLPMLYGVLVHRTSYNVVTLRTESGPDARATAPLFLLQKTGDEFVVWDSDRRTVMWIPRGRVAAAEIGPSQALFRLERACRD